LLGALSFAPNCQRVYPKPVELNDRVVVVTGGTAGVGRATVRAFAQAGARVAVLARDPERLDDTIKEVADAGTTGFAMSLDVAQNAHVDATAGMRSPTSFSRESSRPSCTPSRRSGALHLVDLCGLLSWQNERRAGNLYG